MKKPLKYLDAGPSYDPSPNCTKPHLLLASMGEMKLSHDSFLKFSNRRAFRGCWGQGLSLTFDILTSKNFHRLWKDIFLNLKIIFCFLDCTLPFRVGIFTNGGGTVAAPVEDADGGRRQSRGVCLDYKQI